jgi:hypothetical protein
MKKDIPIHSVTDIGIAIIPLEIDQVYEVYLINKKKSGHSEYYHL